MSKPTSSILKLKKTHIQTEIKTIERRKDCLRESANLNIDGWEIVELENKVKQLTEELHRSMIEDDRSTFSNAKFSIAYQNIIAQKRNEAKELLAQKEEEQARVTKIREELKDLSM